MSLTGVTIRRNGHTYTYDSIITVDYRYLALLSQEFTRDPDVSIQGEWGMLQVKTEAGIVVWDSGAVRVSRIGASKPFTITVFASYPGPYHVFFTLFWYYPSVGVFTKVFRVGTARTQVGNVLAMQFDPVNPVYRAALKNARRSLASEFKTRIRAPASGGRLNPEEAYSSTRKYFDYSSHPEVHSDTSVSYLSYRRTWTGVRTPGYWSMRKKRLPQNAHTSYQIRVHADTCLRHQEWPHPENPDAADRLTQIDKCTNWWSIPTGLPDVSGEADLPALSRLRSKMGTETVNVAQDIGEIGETIAMIHKTISRIRNAHAALKKGNLPGAIESLWTGREASRRPQIGSLSGNGLSAWKTLAENWLELQYGWKPLLNDVHDGIEKASRFFNQSGSFPVGQVSGSATRKNTTVTLYDSNYIPLGQGAGTGRHVVTSSQRTKYGVRFKVADAHVAFLAQTGFTNPVDLIWELLPYSFVVDWFLPIGPWLESFTAFQGLEFLDGYKLQFQRANINFSAHGKGVVPPSVSTECWYTEDALFLKERIDLVRAKLTSWPLPTLPHFKSPWSTGHVLNGLALLAAGFGVSSRYHV